MFDFQKMVPAFNQEQYVAQLANLANAYFTGTEKVLTAQREAFENGMKVFVSKSK